MSSQYSPEKRTVGTLLSTTNPPIVVPEWQRNYSWTTTEVDTFWSDLLGFSDRYPGGTIRDEDYFLGSVVIVASEGKHLLLDGQQRIATAAILLSVIRDFLRRYRNDAGTRTQSRYLGDLDDSTNQYAYKITLNQYDRDFFKRLVLEDRAGAYQPPAPQLASHRLIARAREYFEVAFEERYAGLNDPATSYQWALRVQEVLTNHMSVVAVFTQDEDNAASVFETLNDRGIGLSTPDLLRNLVLRRAPEPARAEITDLWGEVLELESDTSLKAFLRHYWISRYGDVKTQSLYREIKRRILAENTQSLDFSRSLRDEALLYRDITTGRDDDEPIAGLFRDINDLGGTLLLPLVLSARVRYNNTDLKQLLSTLVNVYVRHSLIGQLENSRLENIVYRLAMDIRDGLPVTDAQQRLADFAPTDEQFRAAFGVAEVTHRDSARYLLKKLEEGKRKTAELDVAPPPRVHIEHIYPQSPKPGNRLINHSRLVNRIGNLTLLSGSLNSAIKNGTFDEKRPTYQASELVLTLDLGALPDWSEVQIGNRQAQLAQLAPSIWPLPVMG